MVFLRKVRPGKKDKQMEEWKKMDEVTDCELLCYVLLSHSVVSNSLRPHEL